MLDAAGEGRIGDLVLGVGDDRQHGRERHAAAPGELQRDGLGPDVELGVLGGEQDALERVVGHGDLNGLR